jgi:transposase
LTTCLLTTSAKAWRRSRKKPTQRVTAAINYLEEDEATLEDVAERYGYTADWLSRWLDRLERLADEPFEEVVCDEHRSGRPSEFSDEQYDQFIETLHASLEEAGLDAPAWSVPLARHSLAEEFDVRYFPTSVISRIESPN